MELKGRRKIYTDVSAITKENIFDVLQKALMAHEQNRADMAYLLKFEKGVQPLVREKPIRPEIDIKSIANLANEITEFKLGYFWGNPVALVQKSDKLPIGSDKKVDNTAITILNDMYFAEEKDSKDQQLARYVEICGVGYQMIDIKRDCEEGDSPFDLLTLNPLFTFIVYSSDVYHRPMMGVTYSLQEDGSKLFTCITDDTVYIIDSSWKIINGKKSEEKLDYKFGNRSGEVNPLGEVYIIEFERSFDRTGCFERQVDELNSLNVLESDLVNDIAQNTQAIWWGNDIKLEEDENGNVKGVKGGQWILTTTNGGGQKPAINSLTLQYDYTGVIENIRTKHDFILERAFVPKQSDPSGGSTGTAMSLSSGWSAAESVACKEALVLKKSFQRRNKLALKAIRKSPNVSVDSPVLELSANDVEIRFIRQKTFDMSSKVNSFATMIEHFVNPKVAMAQVDFFSDLAEAIDESAPMIEEYQRLKLEQMKQKKESDAGQSEKLLEDKKMPDSSDQTENSPILDK